jgi:hypothetical protein
MNAEMVASTIQLILAPVVMVTACALILNGVLARYAAVNDRLRLLSRERFDLVRAGRGQLADDEISRERLQEIDAQVPELVRHHRLLHDGVLAVYAAILVFVLDMFVIAIAAMSGAAWLATAALLTFLGGTGVLLIGVLLTALEVRTSHRAVQFEAERVSRLASQ